MASRVWSVGSIVTCTWLAMAQPLVEPWVRMLSGWRCTVHAAPAAAANHPFVNFLAVAVLQRASVYVCFFKVLICSWSPAAWCC
jgi:hypothetical protein